MAAEFVRERPSHSIGDKPAFDPEDDVAEEGHPAGWPDVAPYPSRGRRIGVEKPSERGAPSREKMSSAQLGDVADHDLGREVVVLDPRRLALLTRQKRDQRAQHFVGAPEPFARDLDDGMRPTGFAQLVEHKSRLPAPAHEARPPSIRSEGEPERQRPLMDGPLPGRDGDQVAGGQVRQLGASLGVGGVKFAGHQEIVGRPALRSSAKFGDDAAGDRPFASERRANLLSRQRHGREPTASRLATPTSSIGDAADPPPELVRRVSEQGRRRAEREVFASSADGLLHGAHRHPRRGVHRLRGGRLPLPRHRALKFVPNEMQDFGSVHVRSSLSLRRSEERQTHDKHMI